MDVLLTLKMKSGKQWYLCPGVWLRTDWLSSLEGTSILSTARRLKAPSPGPVCMRQSAAILTSLEGRFASFLVRAQITKFRKWWAEQAGWGQSPAWENWLSWCVDRRPSYTCSVPVDCRSFPKFCWILVPLLVLTHQDGGCFSWCFPS